MTQHRFLEKNILEDLSEKMVFIGGPRQVGKTTLSSDLIAKHHFKSFHYYNWDSKKDRINLLNEQFSDASLLIFDEIHKYKLWKTMIKGLYDKNKLNQSILVTGSARLNVFRRGGDSLQGRYHYYRLHPFSLNELSGTLPKLSPFESLSFSKKPPASFIKHLMFYGGFPEPFLKQSERHLRRWHKEKVERLFREDIRDTTSIKNIQDMQLLADTLPNKVASQLSLNNLREDLQVSHKAVSLWINTLESLYYCYRLYPFQSNLIRALKKDAKLYLWDWSELENQGAKFENLIASHLLKTVHYLQDYEGLNTELFYVRDKEKREVDFIVTLNHKAWFLVEAKTSKPESLQNIRYFKKKLSVPFAYIVTLENIARYQKSDICVLSAQEFLTGLV